MQRYIIKELYNREDDLCKYFRATGHFFTLEAVSREDGVYLIYNVTLPDDEVLFLSLSRAELEITKGK